MGYVFYLETFGISTKLGYIWVMNPCVSKKKVNTFLVQCFTQHVSHQPAKNHHFLLASQLNFNVVTRGGGCARIRNCS